MRVIQMGIGGWGNAWLERLMPFDFVTHVGFVEFDKDIARTQAKKHNLDEQLIFPTLQSALKQVEADAVIAVIPPRFRTETLQTCIDHRLPLLAEKPLAENLADAQRQVDLANESDHLYMIAQNYRYRPEFVTIKNILDSGELGPVGAITISHYRGVKFGGFRAEMPYPLINDMVIHHFDLLRFLLETEAESIYGQSWSAPWNEQSGHMSTAALLAFPNNVHVSYTASWSSMGHVTSFNGDWRIECEKGVLTMVDDEITVQKRKGSDDIWFTFSESEARPKLTSKFNPQAHLTHELYEGLQNGHHPPTSVQDNIKSLAMIFDLIESCETGQIIKRGSQ
jgi:predicted dehydrogenase